MKNNPFIILLCSLFFIALMGCAKSENEQPKTGQYERNLIPQKYDTLSNVITPPVLDEAPYRVSLIKEVEYGDSEDAYISDYLSVGGLSLTVSFLRFAVGDNGQVFIANNHQIEAFDAEGNHLKTLGRQGRGPGEFNNHHPLVPRITSNSVYAFDHGSSRINVYQADSLSFSHSFILDKRIIMRSLEEERSHLFLSEDEILMVNDSLILLGFIEPYQESVHGGFKRFIMLNYRSGEVVSDSILYYKMHPNNSSVSLVLGTGKKLPYIPKQMPPESYMKVSFDQDHNIYAARGEDFLIKEYDRDGTYKRAIYYPYEHSRLDSEDREAIIEYHATKSQREEDYDYPSHWPAIHEFFVDDEGRIWVATITDDNENYEWWILKNDGQLIAKFKRSGERIKRNYQRQKSTPLPIVKNGYFYISETDEESGANVVVKYKIVLQENS
jgi:hypothetical protein